MSVRCRHCFPAAPLHPVEILLVEDNPSLRDIAVVIVTSSPAEQDVLRSFQLNVSRYLAQFGKGVRAIDGFWFRVVLWPADSRQLADAPLPAGPS